MSDMTEKPKAKTGRPSLFTPELADEICTRLANGESLRTICNSDRDDFIPSIGTVVRWVSENEQFQIQYAKAREIQAETMADEIVSIADAVEADAPSVAKARLQVDSRKWVASKLLPKKYGDKLTQEHVGADGGPIQTESRIDMSALTDEQARLIASLPIKGGG